MSQIKTKRAEIPLSFLIKTYQETASSKTKELLDSLFPDLKKKIKLKKYPNIVQEKVTRGTAILRTKYHYVEDGQVRETVTIENKHTRGYGKIYIKHIPYKMLKRINYFKEQEEE